MIFSNSSSISQTYYSIRPTKSISAKSASTTVNWLSYFFDGQPCTVSAVYRFADSCSVEHTSVQVAFMSRLTKSISTWRLSRSMSLKKASPIQSERPARVSAGHGLCLGNHFVIPTDGTIEPGGPKEMTSVHCKNHNRHSIGFCELGGLSEGGLPIGTRTEVQRFALRRLLEQLHMRYPKALILGQGDLDPRKACPYFNAVSESHDLNA